MLRGRKSTLWGWKWVLAGALALLPIAARATDASAFADTYVVSYTQSNLNPHDTTYGPDSGQIWASNFAGPSAPQYIQAENWDVIWNSTTAYNVRYAWPNVATVFHVFQYGTSNCALPFDYDNNYVSSQTDASVYAKNATCGIGGPYGSYNNEARVYWPGSDVNGGQYYYGGVEFRLNNGDLYTPATGKVANDLYFYGLVGSQKDNVSNGTWCFDGTNGHVWGC